MLYSSKKQKIFTRREGRKVVVALRVRNKINNNDSTKDENMKDGQKIIWNKYSCFRDKGFWFYIFFRD